MTDYQIKLPKGTRTMSGEVIAERHGSEILDEFIEYLDTIVFPPGLGHDIKQKLFEIEKSYGIDRVE